MRKLELKNFLHQALPYIVIAGLILGFVVIGSRDKVATVDSSMSLSSIAANNYAVSADQVSEFYIVAELADALALTSASDVANNFVSISMLNQDDQALDDSTGKIVKPVAIDISAVSRGVIVYTVKTGDTMASIASAYGLTTDQIRWSNNLKTTDVAENQTLLLPSVPGIVYTVKDGDTVDSLAKKYGANADEIIAVNDLEQNQLLSVGASIVLPSGALPETERPEYVAPQTYAYSSTYSYGNRLNLRIVERWSYAASKMNDGNRNTPGQCTWYAWYWRKYYSSNPLPAAVLGNANAWANKLANYGYTVNRTPSAGAVFQTSAGYYGHVGIVIAVNSDGSILVREMNYNHMNYVVTESTIPASQVGNYNYIH